MRACMSVCAVLVVAAVIFGQNASPAGAGGAASAAKQSATAAAKEDVEVKPAEEAGRPGSPPYAVRDRRDNELDRPCPIRKAERKKWRQCENAQAQPFRRSRFLVLKAMAGMFMLGFLAYATVNVLLTILVSMDMVRLGRFNGLWIPILLIVGIPGTIMYALFRIGDIMRSVKSGG
jgi:hypothetical protein